MSQGKQSSTPQQRIQWLVDHKELWLDMFQKFSDCLWEVDGGEVDDLKKKLISQMKDAGLFSRKSYWMDCKLKHVLTTAYQMVTTEPKKGGQQMSYQNLVDQLRREREHIARELQNRITKINAAIEALESLNGKPAVAEAAKPAAVGRPVKKATIVVRKHERAGMILKRIGMHYVDVAIDAVRRAGRPVTTEEVYQHLKKLAGKQLNRRIYMARIGVCLRREALNGAIAQSKVPDSPRRESLWNVVKASDLDLQRGEVLSADIK